MPICGPSGLPAALPLDTMQPRECVEFVYSLVRAAAASLICSRKAFRPTLFVARQAFRARSRKALSDGATTSLSRASSSHPAGLPWCCSICRANLSPMGREDLIWLHMLGEICSVAAFLVSDANSYMNGETVVMDGGLG